LPIGEFWHPAIGAVGFMAVGVFVPRALGVGYDVIGDILDERLAVGVVAGLAAGKLLAWWLALASGTSGGTLAPILLISSGFGTVVGAGLNEVLPGPHIALGAFAVVAMAATFGAATRATFASIVFVFELTRDYNVILPLMLATVLADLVYSALNEDSIMTEKLTRRGLRLGRHYGVDPFTTTAVSAIMTTPVATLPASATIAEARQRFGNGGHSAYPVVEDDRLVGIVGRGDVLRGDTDAVDQPREDTALREVASRDVVTVKPSDSTQTALQAMLLEGVEHVPVVDGDRLVGIVTRTDLLAVRRSQLALEHPQDPPRLRAARNGG
jgi:CBS domain-containing protein